MDALLDSSIRFITTRHEQGAAFMADVYGRLTGRAGVCLSTLGPGATNLVTGIADANMDHAPVVAIAGQAGIGDVIVEAGARRGKRAAELRKQLHRLVQVGGAVQVPEEALGGLGQHPRSPQFGAAARCTDPARKDSRCRERRQEAQWSLFRRRVTGSSGGSPVAVDLPRGSARGRPFPAPPCPAARLPPGAAPTAGKTGRPHGPARPCCATRVSGSSQLYSGTSFGGPMSQDPSGCRQAVPYPSFSSPPITIVVWYSRVWRQFAAAAVGCGGGA